MFKEVNIISTNESWGYIIDKKPIGYDLIENTIIFLTAYVPAALLLFAVKSSEAMIYRGLLLIFPIYLMTYMRRKYEKPYKHMMAVLIILMISLLLSVTLEEKIVYFIILFVSGIKSISKRTVRTATFYNMGALFVSLAILGGSYIAAYWYKLNFIQSFITLTAVFISLIFIMYLYILNTSKLIKWETLYGERFEKRLKNLKAACSVFIIFTTVFLIALAYEGGIFDIVDNIGNGFIRIVNDVPDAPQNNIQQTQENVPQEQIPKELQKDGETPYIVKVLGKIIIFAIGFITAVIVLVILWAMIKAFLDFYRNLFHKEVKKVEERELVISLESIENLIKNRKFPSVKFGSSNNEKIRKLYHRRVKYYMTKGVKIHDSNTPIEIEKNIYDNFHNDLEKITEVYERARYSREISSDEELDFVKKALKKG